MESLIDTDSSQYVSSLLATLKSSFVDEHLAQIVASAKSQYPESTPEQDAWEKLTLLEIKLGELESSIANYEQAFTSYQYAITLNKSFEKARSTVLDALYARIKDRFVLLYRSLHGEDEATFSATLQPEKAGLNFEVDFYGRSMNPPHALHSEGHQDSMGLCLYLALAEELTKDIIDLVILDDVMMSVDSDHRQRACQILSKMFPNRQFLITTHDKTWARQLQDEGVITPESKIEFVDWSIENGPKINRESDMWAKIKEDMKSADVPAAAQKLRRGSEEFFETVCDYLQTRVVYKSSHQWVLGDYLTPTMSKFKELLKDAVAVAESWDDLDAVERLREVDTIREQIYKRVNIEQWAINTNVHYNSWANFSQEDFQPVVEAFQDLHGLFRCSQCSGILRIVKNDLTQTGLACNCGKTYWNLSKKKEN